MRDALQQVREVLGPDAMILDQCKQDGLVQISACLELPQGYSQSEPEQKPQFSVPVAPLPRILKKGWYRFIGPTGAGKTTTLIKLAANHVFQYGSENLLIFSTDKGRLAANEQLQLAGELLKVDVVELSDQRYLADALREVSANKLVLIDSQGLNLESPDVAPLLGVETLFVASAAQQKNYLKKVLSVLEGIPISGCVLTHLDEVTSLDEVLSLCTERNHPVSWIGVGPSLSDDIESATQDIIQAHIDRLSFDETPPNALDTTA